MMLNAKFQNRNMVAINNRVLHVLGLSLMGLLLLLPEVSQAAHKKSGDYLYNSMSRADSAPIIDYIPPKVNNVTNGNDGSEMYHPSFLYSTTGDGAVARVVEFYAPWCPHCQHFAPNYVKFARRMEEIVKPYGVQVDHYAVSCTVNKKLCQDQGIHAYPTVKVFAAGSYNGTLVKFFDLHPFQVLRDIGIQVDTIDIPEEEGEDKDTTTSERHLKSKGKGKNAKKFVLNLPNIQKRTKAELYGDAYRSFHFAMKTGVYMANGPLPNKTVPVLLDWLDLLQNTLPPTWSIQPLIKKLLDEFDSIIKGEDEMVAVLDQFPPSSNEWSYTCTHGVEAMGYTCGLWELFHIMTVGVVEYNKQVIGDDEYSFYRTEQVAEELRNYIANFFGCEVCRLNFLHAFDTCALDRCNRLQDQVGDIAAWKQLPLWLFETHNAVNVRLMKEQAERDNYIPTLHDEMKAQWPPRLDCPKCWKEDGSWDEEIVYLYLIDQYWPDDGQGPQTARRELFHPTIEIEPNDMEEEGSWSSRLTYGGVLLVAATIAYFYRQRINVVKTGRHKRDN